MKSFKTIVKIAQSELKTLFYSPVAWLLIIIMLIQAAVSFTNSLQSIAQMQELGVKWDESVADMIFQGRNGVCSTMMQSLYLYLPLLTMGLISREMSSGTIKLLYTSPISIRDIVLGKFFSMALMCLLMVAVVGMFIGCSYFVIDNPDSGKFFSSLLGLYLLFTAQAAIGLFMSSLTTYQIVAAVCTFVVMWSLYLVGGLWQEIAWVRNITYFLSISGRTNKMLGGLITSKDIVYFCCIMYLFIGLSILRLRAGMESKSLLVKSYRYIALIASVLVIGSVSSIPSLVVYFDVTRNKDNTLVPAAQKIVSSMSDAPLTVTGYANLLGGYWTYGSPESYNTNLAQWEPYMRFDHNIQLKSVLYYDTMNVRRDLSKIYPGKNLLQIARLSADALDMKMSEFKKPEEIRKIVDLSQEPGWYIMQLEYKGRKTLLRLFEDSRTWPTETEVAAALKRLQQAKMPKALFVTGDWERNIHKLGDREYKALANLNTFRYSLVNQGFDVDTISLADRDIPKGITALVLADPKTTLTAPAMKRLQQFVDDGGNLFLSVEPGKQQLINPFLQQFGVHVLDGMIAQTNKDMQPELAITYLTDAASSLYPALLHAHHGGAKVTMPTTAAFSYSDSGAYKIAPLLMTDSAHSWLKKRRLVTDSGEVVYTPADSDIRKDFPTALQLTRKLKNKEQRIVITADADFMANAELMRTNMRTANFIFTTGIFSWLNYGEFPIDSSRPPATDRKLLLTKDQAKIFRLIFVWIVPGVLLLFGMVLLIRRKRK